MKIISPLELYELVRQGQPVELIDVRTPAEFQEVHAELAVSMPMDALDPAKVIQARKAADQPLYFICRSGGRSQRVCDYFVSAGYSNVVNVDGGTLAWLEANLPAVWADALLPQGAISPQGGESAGGCGNCGCQSKKA